MGALCAALQNAAREKAWQDYMAQMAWETMRQGLPRNLQTANPYRSWLEMITPANAQAEQSGAEIFDDLKNKLKERRAAREAV